VDQAPHPDNEPGKSYQTDERRRAAALTACEGLPTEWLERGVVGELYKFVALIALADKMADRTDGFVRNPEGWWDEHVRGGLDALNRIAAPGKRGGATIQ
jgi:hypothetical protein